jgi:hypothetical protein
MDEEKLSMSDLPLIFANSSQNQVAYKHEN